MNDNLFIIGVPCGIYDNLPTIVFLDQNYQYKSATTEITQDADQHYSHTLIKISLSSVQISLIFHNTSYKVCLKLLDGVRIDGDLIYLFF